MAACNKQSHEPFAAIFPVTLAISALLVIAGLAVDGPMAALRGLYGIITQPDLLISDYVATSGVGAAMLNAGLVTGASVLVLKLSRDPFNGFSIVTVGLMLGFSFFGKNIATMWPFVLGSWLCTKVTGYSFADYASVGLMSSSLSPLVSYMALGSVYASIPLGIFVGMLVGFIMPVLSPYTYRIQNGMNLYNVGFASGLMAMMIVPVLTALGDSPPTALHWSEGWDRWLLGFILLSSLVSLAAGLFFCKRPAGEVLRQYRELLGTTGRTPSDYLRMFGFAPSLVNMGVNGLFCLLVLFAIGGDLNGPTAGAIISIMGFSAWGKHLRNMMPLMLGVILGSTVLHFSIRDPALQIAVFFVTTLAPVSGHFGWPFGLLTGFIHSALVLQTSGPVSGLNLYNNGFSGGLITIVCVPVAAAIFNHHLPKIRDASFFEVLEDELIEEEDWDMKETGYLHPFHTDPEAERAFEQEPGHVHEKEETAPSGDK